LSAPTLTERLQILIVFSMQIVAADAGRAILQRTLKSMLGPTRVAPGCLDARLYQNLDNSGPLLFVEEWASRMHFENNLDSRKLNLIVAAIELSSEPPLVRVDKVDREEGVETLGIHRYVGMNTAKKPRTRKRKSRT
jgi:quinol monooxygenase YgiN